MATVDTVDFLVKRDDLKTFSFEPSPRAEDVDLADGEVLLKVDRFAFTANNVTYGVVGDRFSYWDFFPAGRKAGAAFRSGALPTFCARTVRL